MPNMIHNKEEDLQEAVTISNSTLLETEEILANPTDWEDGEVEVIKAAEFIDFLVDEVSTAEEVIELQFMSFWPRGKVLELIEALITRKNEIDGEGGELEVTIACSQNPIMEPEYQEPVQRMIEAGVNIILTDEEKKLPSAGVNHRKLFVIDNVCGLGGSNATAELDEHKDYIFLFRDHKAAREHILYEILYESDERTSEEEAEIVDLNPISGKPPGMKEISEAEYWRLRRNTNRMVIEREGKFYLHLEPIEVFRGILSRDKDPDRDGSKALLFENALSDRESIGIKAAVEMIDNSDDTVIITGQWPPDGKVLLALSRAIRRGVDVEIVTNTPTVHLETEFRLLSEFNFKQFKLMKEILDLQRNLPDFFRGKEFGQLTVRVTDESLVHSKLLYTRDKSGKSAVLMGSENFVWSGAFLQTRESLIYLSKSSDVVMVMDKVFEDIHQIEEVAI